MAIARTLINDPVLLLADEPTGNLDTAASIEIMRLLSALNDAGRTVVMITHEEDVAAHAQALRDFVFRPMRTVFRQLAHRPPPFDTYHTPGDTLATLDPAALDRVARALEAVVNEMGGPAGSGVSGRTRRPPG